MRKRLFFFIIYLLLFSAIFANSSDLNLSPEEKEFIKANPEITAGIFNVEPYTFVKNEEVSGFTIELLKKIAERAGLKLNFKVFYNIPERIKSLENNEVQLLTFLIYSKERETKFQYGKQNIELKFSIFTNQNSAEISSLNDFRRKKIAIIKGHVLNRLVKEQYPELEIIETESVEDALHAVERDEVDATILDETVGNYKTRKQGLENIKVIQNDGFLSVKRPKIYGYASTPDNKILISILDKAFALLDRNDMLNLLRDWSLSTPVSEINKSIEFNLTQEEIEWLEGKEYLSVGALSSFHPFSYIEDGEAYGYSVDTMKLIGEVLQKDIRFVKKTWSEELEMLKRGEIDIMPHIAVNEIRKEFVTYTDFIHLTFLIGFITQKNIELNSMKDLEGKKLAVVNRYYLHDYLEEKFPNLELLILDSTKEVVEAVAYGKAYAGIDNLPTLNYFIQEGWVSNLKSTTVSDFGIPLITQLPMGVKKENYILKSILEKANEALSREEISQLKQKWINTDLDNRIKRVELTEEEKAYLDKKSEILMCIDPAWLPFEAFEGDEHIGMSSDYFDLFAQSIGKPIKVVKTETWVESLEVGKARECDIFSLVMPTKERREYLDFTKPYLRTPLVIATQPEEVWIRDLNLLEGKKLAIVEGYAYVEILREEYPQLELFEVKNIHEGLAGVEEGKFYGFVGALSTVGYNIQNDYFGLIKISGKFKEKLELSIGVRNDEPLLTSIFNKAISNLSDGEHVKIFNRWVNVQLEDDPNILTDKELEFIINNPVIRFLVRKSRPPFELEQDGKAAGIAVEYLQEIAKKVGIEAEFVLADISLQEAYEQMGKTKDFDTLVFTVKNEERAKRFAFGGTYLSYPMMIITNKESPYIGKTADLIDKNVAIEKSFLTNQWLKKDYPGINIISVDTTKDALAMVNRGEVDAYIGNLAVANYMLVHGGMNNLKIQAPSDYGNINYSFVAPKEWPELVSILTKGYNMLSPQEHNLIQQKWFSVQLVERFNYELFWRIFSFAIVILFIILYWNRRLSVEKNKTQKALTELHKTQEILKEKYKELEELSITDKLTTLYNRVKLDEVLGSEFEREKRNEAGFGIILLDIDHFKKVNDTYGHQIGDILLTEFADILKNSFRKIDTVGRWGGEEFLIICPGISKEDLIKLADKIRGEIETADFTEVKHKTASFGCSLSRGDSSIDEIITRADDALYESKRNGRNRVTFK